MTPEKLKETVFDELIKSEIKSWHGITKENIVQLLTGPVAIELTCWRGERKSYWLVLDEQPKELEEGYQVVYDERENMFGLATKTTIESKELGYLVGLNGSFVDALNNM